jgi:hypothetical protein
MSLRHRPGLFVSYRNAAQSVPGIASGARGKGAAEMFTLQRLKLPPSQYKCLATANLIESRQSGGESPVVSL